jgi:glycosyltransferase involved in cell wall biosynthesis
LRVLYVSYDGALDPLGGSQVLPYVIGLARTGVSMKLLSFEKIERWADSASRGRTAALLSAAAVGWKPLRYHQRPRLPATVWDLYRAHRAIGAEARGAGPVIVHCRGDVAMTAARRARLPREARILYDVRGLFSDERVESGSWPRGGLIDHIVRRSEAANLRRADGIVVLTEPARRILEARRAPLPPHAVIPTSVDLECFAPGGTVPDHGLVYLGSLGTWYMTAEIVQFSRLFFAAQGGRSLFLTPQTAEARAAGVDASWAELASIPHGEVPAWLRRCRAMVYFIRPTPAKQASCPTKLAEALATGIPIVTNRGIGGLEPMIESHRVGVVLDELGPTAYEKGLKQLRNLLDDPATGARCRALAEARFSLDRAVLEYRRLYDRIGLPGA